MQGKLEGGFWDNGNYSGHAPMIGALQYTA
jgi:hypothetical protein